MGSHVRWMSAFKSASLVAACLLLPRCTALVSTSDLAVGGGEAAEGGPPAEGGAVCPEGGAAGDGLCAALPCGGRCAPRTGAICKSDGSCGVPRACADLVTQRPRLPSGVYRIDPGASGSGAFDAYCDMDPTAEGGGWTLLLKVDGGGTRFHHDRPVWTDDTTFNEDQPDLDLTEAKLAGFSSMPLMSVRVGMVDRGTTRWLMTPLVAGSLRAVFAGDSRETPLGRRAWRALVASASTQDNCNREGFNIQGGTGVMRLRIGMLFNNEPDCSSVDSYVGIGSNIAGVLAGNLAGSTNNDNGERETPVMAYVMIR